MDILRQIIEQILSAIVGFLSGVTYTSYRNKKEELKSYKKHEDNKTILNNKYDNVIAQLRHLSKVQEAGKTKDDKR